MFDFLKEASPELMSWLVNEGSSNREKADTVILKEGVISEHVLVVLEGEVAINTTDQNGDQQCLAVLKQGTIIGEMSWLEQRPAVANVVTQTTSNVLYLKFESLDLLSKVKPGLAAEWQRLIAKKLSTQIQSQNAWIHRYEGPGADIEPLRKVLILFAELDDEDVDTLARLGALRRIQPAGTLIQQGQPVPSLFLILAGEADILVEIDGIKKKVGSSRRGELLGELTLLSNEIKGATATVHSVDGMELLELDKIALENTLLEKPDLANRFFRSLSCMLSQRSRDQLLARQLATRSQGAESSDDNDELNLNQLGGINRAGQRFNTLCRKFQSDGSVGV